MADNQLTPEQAAIYDAYVEMYKQDVTGKAEASKSFDQALLALSGGALGLSVTFYENFIPAGQAPQVELVLFVAWVLFAAALGCTLTSFLTAHEAYRVELDKLNASIKEWKLPDQKNKLTDWTYKLNRAALIFFVFGVVSLIAFAAINLIF
jgi:hypothetical protein